MTKSINAYSGAEHLISKH